MVPSKDYVRRCLELAEECLEDAQALLRRDRLRAAADRAYYAMYHAAQAVLYNRGLKPKTHAGLRSMFSEHLVKPKKVSAAFAEVLAESFKLRQISDYEADAVINPEKVKEIVEKAAEFLAKMKELVG